MKRKAAVIAAVLFLSGCAQSYYKTTYTFMTPLDSGKVEVVSGEVGGTGLTLNRVLVEHERAFKLLLNELRRK